MWVNEAAVQEFQGSPQVTVSTVQCRPTDHSSTSESQDSKETNCWNTPRPTAIDIEATETFIDIVKDSSIQLLLKDKKTTKNKVWIKVYNEMVKRGYCVHSVEKEGGIKCSQKGRNLERNYAEFKLNSGPKSTGRGRKDPPPYYELLHSVFADKHTVQPPVLLDTLNLSALKSTITTYKENENNLEQNEDDEISGDDTSAQKPTEDNDVDYPLPKRLKGIKKSSKPKNKILEEIQKQHSQDMDLQKKILDLHTQALAEQKEQTKVITQLVNFLVKKN